MYSSSLMNESSIISPPLEKKLYFSSSNFHVLHLKIDLHVGGFLPYFLYHDI